MKQLIDLLPLLKVGTSKDSYPVYAQCLYSNGERVQTCNNNIFINLECKLPFTGLVNFQTINSIVTKLTEQEEKNQIRVSVSTKDDKLIFRAPPYNYEVLVMDLDFPKVAEPDIKTIEVTDEIIEQLKIAHKFVGKGIMSYVYLYDKGILATDTHRIYHRLFDFEIESPIAINNKILSVLYDGCHIGSDTNNNTVVIFPNGYGIFTVDNVSYYPASKILSMLTSKDVTSYGEFLCNILALREWTEAVLPIYGSDTNTFVSMTLDKNGLRLNAEAAANGTAQMTPDVQCELDAFDIIFDASYLKDIPSSFDVFVKGGETLDKFVLKDDETGLIVLMGAKNS
jgi:hypothetical protein